MRLASVLVGKFWYRGDLRNKKLGRTHGVAFDTGDKGHARQLDGAEGTRPDAASSEAETEKSNQGVFANYDIAAPGRLCLAAGSPFSAGGRDNVPGAYERSDEIPPRNNTHPESRTRSRSV